MWKSLTGRSANRSEQPDSQTTLNGKRSSRSRSDSLLTSSTRKSSRSDSKRNDDQEAVAYSSTSHAPSAAPTSATAPSSYATANTRVKGAQQPTDTYGIEHVPSRYSNSQSEEPDKYEIRSNRGRKDRTSGRERKQSNISSKGSQDREEREKPGNRPRKRESLPEYDRKGSESSATRKSRSSRSSKPSRAATMPVGSRGIEDDDLRFQHQLPGQLPSSFDPSPQFVGLAADYYGDHGESVADQPGVRPVVPSVILGPDTHLHEPSIEAAPPVEPSAMGQVGAAASFYANNSDQESIQQNHVNGRPPKPLASPSYGAPSPRASPGLTTSPGTAVPPMSGLSASYYFADASNNNGQAGQDQTNYGLGASNHAPQQHPEHPTKPGKWSSSGSNAPWAGAAATATAAAAGVDGLYEHDQSHGNHYEQHNPQYNNVYGNTLGGNSQAPPMSQKHRHRGPLSKLVDFFKDPEGVGQYEDYTEYLGVCKYCFDPGSSSRDAPRKHHSRRRLSGGGRYGSSARVDKLNRYASSEDEKRKKARGKAPWVAAGVAGYGLAQAGKSLAQRKDFDDTYSVQSGRPANDGLHYSGDSHDHEIAHKRIRREETEYGIAGVSSRIGSTYSPERRSERSHDSGIGGSHLDEHRFARRKSPRRSTHARISPKSSYVSLTNEGPPGYSSFFSAPSSNQRRHKKKKKGFFTFNNSSSSSSDADLAFGSGHLRRKDSKQSGRSRKENFDLNATVLGLGAATAALAAANSRQSRGRRHGADVVAVKEAQAKHRKGSERRHCRDSVSSESGRDSAWEDASDAESVADSALAYGLATRQSRESLASSESGTEKWAWRWGSKKARKQERDSQSRPLHDFHSPQAAPTHHGYVDAHIPERPTESVVSASSLQQVYPVPTNDPNMFDVARKSSATSSQPQSSGVPYVSQAASVPLKQPQPITPVTAVLNGNQSSDFDPPSGRRNRETSSHDSRTSASGQFLPNQTISESPPQVLSNEPKSSQRSGKRVSWSEDGPKEHRRAHSVPEDRPVQQNGEVFFSRRDSTRERPSNVTFDLPEKELEREQRAKRRRAERRRTDSFSSDHDYADKDQSRHPRRGSHSDGEEQTNDRHFSDIPTRDLRRKSEENLAREEELEREIRQLVEEDQNHYGNGDQKSSSSWVAPAAVGAAGAGFAAAAIHAVSKSDTANRERRRDVRNETDHSETPSTADSGREDDHREYRDRRSRRTGKIRISRSPSAEHRDYESFFIPPELAEHVKEHNVASERRNSMEDRTPTMPQIVEVIPASPSQFPVDHYVPFGSRAEHNAHQLHQPIPRLRLMQPSPPVSIAGSVRGDASPTIIAVEPVDEPPEELLESPSHAKEDNHAEVHHIDTGIDETESPFVDRSKKPSRQVDPPASQPASVPDEPLSPKTRVVDESEEIPRQSSLQDHGVDLAFAAALAAGAQGAGFDPFIIIDDPTYHRRDSPPGSDKGKIHQAPFAETVSDLATETRTDPIPAQVGFVEGEVESPVEEHEEVKEDLRSSEGKPRKRSSKAPHEAPADDSSEAQKPKAVGSERQTSYPKIPGDFDVFDYIEEEDSPTVTTEIQEDPKIVDSMSADEVLSRVSWSSPKALKNDVQDIDTTESEHKANGRRPSGQHDTQAKHENKMEEPGDVEADGQKEPYDFYKMSSSKKSKRKSQRSSVARDEPRDLADVVDEATRTQRKSKSDIGSIEDDASIAASSPGVDQLSEPGWSGRKSKKERRSTKRLDDEFEDKTSTMSSPAKISPEKETQRSGRDRSSSGIFSMFGAVQALSASKDSKDSEDVDEERHTPQENEAGPDDFETPKKKSKKKSKKDKPWESNLESNDVTNEVQSKDPQTSSHEESVSFLGERPEMPLKGDNGASGHFSSPLDSEHGGQPSSKALPADLVPKPAFHVRSRSASPRLTDRNVELPPISLSRPSSPSTPQTRDALRQRRLSALQIGDSTSNPMTHSSPTAIPLTFRRPPISPSHARQASAGSPLNESPSTPQSMVRSRHPRPNSAEVKSLKEFRPLFLVERHSYKHEPEVTETYPSLPSSRTSSTQPSIEDLRNAQQEDTPPKQLPAWFGQPPEGDKRRSWSSFRAQSPDYLDSQQTTPTGTEFPKEVQKPKRKYEFHSPSELLQGLPADHETEEPPMSPILLPKSMSSESLEPFGQQRLENTNSSRERREDIPSSPPQARRRDHDVDIAKSVGLAAAAGAAGAVVAAMASRSPERASAYVQKQGEDNSLYQAPLEAEDRDEHKSSEENLRNTATTLREDVSGKPLERQNVSPTMSPKDNATDGKPVDFAEEDTEPRTIPMMSLYKESPPHKDFGENSAAATTHGLSESEATQRSAPEISPLSLNTTESPPLTGIEPRNEAKTEKDWELDFYEDPVRDDSGARSFSPHVHWPEEPLTAEAVEYDPLRSTQHLTVESELVKGDDSLDGVQLKDADGDAQSMDLLPESTPLPSSDDSDLVKPLIFEGSGAENSPLTVAFERAKAVRGLPEDLGLEDKETHFRADALRKHHNRIELVAAEPPTDKPFTSSLGEEGDVATPVSKPVKSEVDEPEKEVFAVQPHSPTPELVSIDQVEETERREISPEPVVSNYGVSSEDSNIPKQEKVPNTTAPEGTMLEDTLQVSPKPQTGNSHDTKSPVDLEPAVPFGQGESLGGATTSEKQKTKEVSESPDGLDNPIKKEGQDPISTSRESEEVFVPVPGKKGKKKKSKGKSFVTSTESSPSQLETLDPVSAGHQEAKVNLPQGAASHQDAALEDPALREEQQASISASAAKGQEQGEDLIEWTPTAKKGKNGKKAKGKQHADTLLAEPVPPTPTQTINILDQPAEAARLEPTREEEKVRELPEPSQRDREDEVDEQSLPLAERPDDTNALPETNLTNQQSEDITAAEEPHREAALPISDQPTPLEQPVEEFEWAPITRGKKGKKKRQSVPVVQDSSPAVGVPEQVKSGTVEEASIAPDAQSVPSRKQSKKDKKKKKALAFWDDVADTSADASQPADTTKDGATSESLRSSQLTQDDTKIRENILGDVVEGDSRGFEPKSIAADTSGQGMLLQPATQSLSQDASSEAILRPEQSPPAEDRDISKSEGGKDFEFYGVGTETSVLGDASQPGKTDAHDSGDQSTKDSKTIAESLSKDAVETSSSTQDTGSASTAPSKRAKKDKKSRRSTVQVFEDTRGKLQEPEDVGSNILSPDQSYEEAAQSETKVTKDEQSQIRDARSEKILNEGPKQIESKELELPVAQSKKGKKKKKRQTLDWTEEYLEPATAASTDLKPDVNRPNEPHAPRIESVDQTAVSPQTTETPNWPLETPQEERSESGLWTTQAKASTNADNGTEEVKRQNVTESLREEAAIRGTEDKPISDEATLPISGEVEKEVERRAETEESPPIRSPSTYDKENDMGYDDSPTVEAQPLSQRSPIRATFDVSNPFPEEKSTQEPFTSAQAEVILASQDAFQATPKPLLQPEIEGAKETDASIANIAPKLEQASEKNSPIISGWTESGKGDYGHQSFAVSPMESLSRETTEHVSENDDFRDVLHDHDRRHDKIPTLALAQDDSTEFPKKQKNGKKKKKTTSPDETVQYPALKESFSPPNEQEDSVKANDNVKEEQRTIGGEPSWSQSAEAIVGDRLRETSPGEKNLTVQKGVEIDNSPETRSVLETLPAVISKGLQPENSAAHEQANVTESGDLADDGDMAETQEQPESQPEEFQWTQSSKRGKKKGKRKVALRTDEPEPMESENVAEDHNSRAQGNEVSSNDPLVKGQEKRGDMDAIEISMPGSFGEQETERPDSEVTIPTVEQPPTTQAEDSYEGILMKKGKKKKSSKPQTPASEPLKEAAEDQSQQLDKIEEESKTPTTAPVEAEDPDEFSWNVSSKRKKKQKRKGQLGADAAAHEIDVLGAGQSRPEEATTKTTSITDESSPAQAEGVRKPQSKKVKKSKRAAEIAESPSFEPELSKDSGFGQQNYDLPDPSPPRLDNDEKPSNPENATIGDDWAITGKKGKKGKKKQKTLAVEMDLSESPPIKAEAGVPLGDQPTPPDARPDAARFQDPINNDMETVAVEDAKDLVANDEMRPSDNAESAAVPTVAESRETFGLSTEDALANVEKDQLEISDATPHTSGQDENAVSHEMETGNSLWTPSTSRKRSTKDKKRGKKGSPISVYDAQLEEDQGEPEEMLQMEKQSLPTPPGEPIAPTSPAANVTTSRKFTADPPQSDIKQDTEQGYDLMAVTPEHSAKTSVVQDRADNIQKAMPVASGEESMQIEEPRSSIGMRRSSKGFMAPLEPSPAPTTALEEHQADNRGKNEREDARALEDQVVRNTNTMEVSQETFAAGDSDSESFKAAHHVKPSIQKTIETLGATRKRSTSRQRRPSSPSVVRSLSPSAVRSFRDSAMQISDPLPVGKLTHQMNRDSGYVPSPVIPGDVSDFHEQPPLQATSSRPPRPITPTSSSEDLKNDFNHTDAVNRSTALHKPKAASAQSKKRFSKSADVQLSPDHDFPASREFTDEPKIKKQQSNSSPPLSPKTGITETVKDFPETPIHRKPSQIDSTSKDRSSDLFDSSPSMRTPDPSQTPQSNNRRLQKPTDSLHRSPSVHSRRSAELLKQRHEDEINEHVASDDELKGGKQSPTSRQPRSIFGGPVEAGLSHQMSSSPSGKALGTIPENASFSHRGSFDVSDRELDESPSKGVTEPINSQRSWPELNEQHEPLGFGPHPPSKPIGGDLPATPEESEDENARDQGPAERGSKSLGKRASFPTSADLQTANSAGIASSTTHDPITGGGNEAARDMAGIYDGWGASAGSLMSPTRPPSMRKRQSMQQIQDLEARVEQLASENRLLATAKITAEKNLEDAHFAQSRNDNASQEALEVRDLKLSEQDNEIQKLKENLDWIHREVSRLKELNDGLTTTNAALTASTATHDQVVTDLRTEHSHTREQWQNSSRELEDLKAQHSQLSAGMEGIVRHEIEIAVADRDAEIKRLNDDLEYAKNKIRELQQQLLAGRSTDNFTPKDADYFEGACQQLCQHVQAWVKRFSKYSDTRVCRLTSEVRDERIVEKFENAMLDDYDVNRYLADRVKRRDVFVSVVMHMIWNHVFTRYLFGMDREQRQKLKSLEKNLVEIGPPIAVRRWRSLTLMLLTQRESFKEQRAADTEAVVLDIYQTLAKFLPPPAHVEAQVVESLRNVMRVAVDLSIEMRKQRAEYTVLPPLQPEYDTNGDLAHYIYFNAALMNERSGEITSNEALETEQAIVRIVLFPLVVKKGGDNGEGDVEDVVCPAQVLVAKPAKDKKVVRIQSGDRMSIDGGNRSVHSFAPSSMDMGNVI